MTDAGETLKIGQLTTAPDEPRKLREISFRVPCVPVAQPRARATTINGRARMYEAKAGHEIHAFKATVRLAARQAYAGPPLTGPLYVGMTFVFPRPKGMIWKKRPMPRVRKVSKPDVDNLVKSLADSIGLYADDAQIVVCYCQKFIAAGDEQPHVDVVIKELDP